MRFRNIEHRSRPAGPRFGSREMGDGGPRGPAERKETMKVELDISRSCPKPQPNGADRPVEATDGNGQRDCGPGAGDLTSLTNNAATAEPATPTVLPGAWSAVISAAETAYREFEREEPGLAGRVGSDVAKSRAVEARRNPAGRPRGRRNLWHKSRGIEVITHRSWRVGAAGSASTELRRQGRPQSQGCDPQGSLPRHRRGETPC
jgi:hypothetical protein